MNKPVEIKEFESVICKKDYSGSEKYKYISEKNFDDLMAFIQEYEGTDENADAVEFMKIGFKRDCGKTVTFNNNVGLIQLKSGFQIQVLPKIDFGSGDDSGNGATKRLFLRMLRSMKDFPSKVFNEASLKADRMNLYEIFINMYIQEVRQIVKHGLKSGYVEQEENRNYYKGKLIVNKHLQANLAHKERFYVGYEEFHINRPENRIVKATLEKLHKITGSAENSKEIRQLLVSFEMVDKSTAYDKDFSKIVIDRNTKEYENLIKWSKVFLMNKSFTTFSGNVTSRALLFPMEQVYESYVAKELRKIFAPDGWCVSTQESRYYLFVEPRRQFNLRPDIVIRKNGRTIILDTKWKRLINSEGANYGISSSDMYQMYAYSKKYETSEIWLLYPLNKEMRGHSPISFYSGDNTYVRIHFIDLEHIEETIKELKGKIERGTF